MHSDIIPISSLSYPEAICSKVIDSFTLCNEEADRNIVDVHNFPMYPKTYKSTERGKFKGMLTIHWSSPDATVSNKLDEIVKHTCSKTFLIMCWRLFHRNFFGVHSFSALMVNNSFIAIPGNSSLMLARTWLVSDSRRINSNEFHGR